MLQLGGLLKIGLGCIPTHTWYYADAHFKACMGGLQGALLQGT